MNLWKYFASCAVAALMASAPARAEVYYLTTDQTGAQTQIDMNHSTTWAFTAVGTWTLGGGNFVMKDGPKTGDDPPNAISSVGLFVYEGTEASHGAALRQFLYLDDAAFCTAHGGNCQKFGDVPFHFDLGLQLTDGVSYFVELTSPVIDEQTGAYFIKGLDNSTFLNNAGNPPPDQTVTVTSPIPEPVSMVLLGTGLLGLGTARRR